MENPTDSVWTLEEFARFLQTDATVSAAEFIKQFRAKKRHESKVSHPTDEAVA